MGFLQSTGLVDSIQYDMESEQPAWVPELPGTRKQFDDHPDLSYYPHTSSEIEVSERWRLYAYRPCIQGSVLELVARIVARIRC